MDDSVTLDDPLSELAMAKRLPVEFLRRFNVRNHGRDKVLIPYGRRGGKIVCSVADSVRSR